MRNAALGAGLVMALLVATVDANAVPSFTRQTGMTCTQCHVSFGAPVPNFTFAGKKFRINGYRMPFIADKIEAGEVGAINGKRLSISLTPYLSFRYQSTFAAQSKSPGASDPSSVSSNPTSRLSFFPSGALADNIGMWSEFYLTTDGSATGEWTQGLFSFDEYDLRFVHITENNTFGLSVSNQSIREIAGFGPWPVGVTSHLGRGGVRGWSHPNRFNTYLYGWFNDRILVVAGAGTGEDNLDWEQANAQGMLAFAPLNTDQNEVWLAFMTQFGNDGIPIVTNVTPTRDGTLSFRPVDAVTGISATRPEGAGSYTSFDIGDYFRGQFEARYGFVDRGPHAMETAARFGIWSESYNDGAEVTENTLSGAIRYVYERTWGLDATLDYHLTWDFTDSSGVKHEIDSVPAWSLRGSFRPAMNFIVQAVYSNSQRRFLDADATTGWSWSLSADILY